MLLGALLVFLAGYLAAQYSPMPVARYVGPSQAAMQSLVGKNSISGLQVKESAPGVWQLEFNYFYTGARPQPRFHIELMHDGNAGASASDVPMLRPQRGSHHLIMALEYPGAEMRTDGVVVLMDSAARSVVRARVNQVIDWPDFSTWALDQNMATRSPEQNLQQAQTLIDAGGDSQLSDARALLQKLLERNPSFDPAYIELARTAMRTNWGPEGLHQAEGLLATALQIKPDSTDAKILLGYVYAHQRRYVQAEALFREVAKSGSDNLWLQANWGEMLEMEHRIAPAMAEYRTIIAHPMTHDRNDRPRAFAYQHLLALLGERKDFDAMEVLYKQQIAEFGWGSCYSANYTRFLLQIRGDVDGAIDSARRALNQKCDDAPSRELLGLAEYAKWATSKGPSRAEALNQARIFLPVDAKAFYVLATSEHTVSAARQLIAAGEPIDQKDNDNFDALAYALQNRDLDAARRLVALGARPKATVGEMAIPVALLPVLDGDVAGVTLMRRLGVHYAQIRYRGATALDLAKQQGNEAMLSALGAGDAAL